MKKSKILVSLLLVLAMMAPVMSAFSVNALYYASPFEQKNYDQVGDFVAPYAEPTLDGDLSEWAYLRDITDRNVVEYSKNPLMATSYLSDGYKLGFQYSDANLYCAVEMPDFDFSPKVANTGTDIDSVDKAQIWGDYFTLVFDVHDKYQGNNTIDKDGVIGHPNAGGDRYIVYAVKDPDGNPEFRVVRYCDHEDDGITNHTNVIGNNRARAVTDLTDAVSAKGTKIEGKISIADDGTAYFEVAIPYDIITGDIQACFWYQGYKTPEGYDPREDLVLEGSDDFDCIFAICDYNQWPEFSLYVQNGYWSTVSEAKALNGNGYHAANSGTNIILDTHTHSIHTPGDWTVTTPATLDAPGVESRLCKICGEICEIDGEAQTREIPKLEYKTEQDIINELGLSFGTFTEATTAQGFLNEVVDDPDNNAKITPEGYLELNTYTSGAMVNSQRWYPNVVVTPDKEIKYDELSVEFKVDAAKAFCGYNGYNGAISVSWASDIFAKEDIADFRTYSLQYTKQTDTATPLSQPGGLRYSIATGLASSLIYNNVTGYAITLLPSKALANEFITSNDAVSWQIDFYRKGGAGTTETYKGTFVTPIDVTKDTKIYVEPSQDGMKLYFNVTNNGETQTLLETSAAGFVDSCVGLDLSGTDSGLGIFSFEYDGKANGPADCTIYSIAGKGAAYFGSPVEEFASLVAALPEVLTADDLDEVDFIDKFVEDNILYINLFGEDLETYIGKVFEYWKNTDHECESTDWIVTAEATYIADGEKVKICGLCGKILDSEVIPSLADSWVNPFTDINSEQWYYGAIAWANVNNYVNGMTADTFAPNALTNRAMFVTLVGRMNGVKDTDVPENDPFPDVSKDAWYAPYVAWAASNGVVNGRDNGNFAPNDSISRQEMAQLIYNYMSVNGYDMNLYVNENALDSFSDEESIPNWSRTALTWAVSVGLMNGSDGAINPTGQTPRSQVVRLLYNFVEIVLPKYPAI